MVLLEKEIVIDAGGKSATDTPYKAASFSACSTVMVFGFRSSFE